MSPEPSAPPVPFRVGEGWDIHALCPDRPLILGGVHIPYPLGLLGHSDADALLHAITDALLGAAALGDIGGHFPDTDSCYAGANSTSLLAQAHERVRAKGWRIGNIDATIVAQQPRLAPFLPAMVRAIASALGLGCDQINVKAKTSERMDAVGEGKAIEARAVCLIVPLKEKLP